jgi:hypothetical protein
MERSEPSSGLAQLDVASKLGHEPGEPVQVLRRRIGHDVAILRSTYDTPRSERQAADDDEANVRLDKARKQRVK